MRFIRVCTVAAIDALDAVILGVAADVLLGKEIVEATAAAIGSEYIAEAPNAAEALGCAWASAILDGATTAAADVKTGGVAAEMTASEFASPEPPEELFLCC